MSKSLFKWRRYNTLTAQFFNVQENIILPFASISPKFSPFRVFSPTLSRRIDISTMYGTWPGHLTLYYLMTLVIIIEEHE
jgi:hypothetical protein